MADNLVRLGMAMALIMLISACLYGFSVRQSSYAQPNLSGITFQR